MPADISLFDDARKRQDRLAPGISIAGAGQPPGSVGLIVHRTSDGVACVLSAAHVLGARKTVVFQPSAYDGAAYPGDKIGAVIDVYIGSPGEGAVVPISAGSGRVSGNRPFHDSDMELVRVRSPLLNERVYKCGRTTGLSAGVIRQYGSLPSVSYPGVKVQGFFVRPDPSWNKGALSEPGDSGAVWYSRSDGAAVGLHLMGEKTGSEWAFACPLPTLMHKLGVEIRAQNG